MTNTTKMSRRDWVAGALLLPAFSAWASPARTLIEVWKDPSCGCCKDWVAILQVAGFDVRVFETGNNAVRAKLGLPSKLESCHTARVSGYALEGHVPVREIRRLLREKPKAVGLTVPGMPVGSPGMDGPAYNGRQDPYAVLLVQRDGSTTVYQRYT